MNRNRKIDLIWHKPFCIFLIFLDSYTNSIGKLTESTVYIPLCHKFF